MLTTTENQAERRAAWAAARQAVGKYARNPCAAAEQDVSRAIAAVRCIADKDARAYGAKGGGGAG